MTTEPLRAAVVGCGDISAVHVEEILAGTSARLVGVCDPDAVRRDAAAGKGGCPGFDDVTTLLDVVDPQVVHLCTPHDRHADLAAECLARGISVLVEKPLAHTLDEGERLALLAEDSARDGGAVLGVCFQNRYNDHSRAVARLLADGGLGAVLGARATVDWFRDAAYYADRPWRARWASAGGGVLMNQAIHTLDLLLWFLGPAVDVRGTAATLALPGTIEVEDSAVLRIRHGDTGAPVTSLLSASNGHVENAPVAIEIRTERALVRMSDTLTVTHDDGRVEILAGGDSPAPRDPERDYWGRSHGRLIADFHACVAAGDPFWIDAATALESLRVVQAVYDQSPGLIR